MTVSLKTPTVGELLAAIAAKTPAPGGGAVASLTAALAAALAEMVVNYSHGKKTLAEHAELHEEALRTLETLRQTALDLADADAHAYKNLNALWKLPADDETRVREMPAAVTAAIDAPMQVAATALGLLHLLQRLQDSTNRHLASDLAIAAILADAAVRAAQCNVTVNLPLLDAPSAVADVEEEMRRHRERACRLREGIEKACGSS